MYSFVPGLGFLKLTILGKSSWRSGNDIGQLYDNVTPNPTGSLSGPYFVESPGKTVIGIKGKTSNIGCSIKNLGNLTVSVTFGCWHQTIRPIVTAPVPFNTSLPTMIFVTEVHQLTSAFMFPHCNK